MEPFPLEDRGFFASDLTQLQLDLIDRASGRLLWSNRVEKEIDPRDSDALDALFTDALAGEPWTRSARPSGR